MRQHHLLLGAGLAGLLLSVAACAPLAPRPEAPAPQAAPEARDGPATPRAPRETTDPPVPPPPRPTLLEAPARQDAATADAVLDRLARRLHEPHCNDPAVHRAARLQLRNRKALGEKLARVLPLLDYVMAGIEARDLPGQFALIPWAESGFRADPGNRGNVQGLWQFTVSTGRGQGLRIDQRYDGRRAAIESTDAALDHLVDLMARFGDWRLAILAYNVGPGGLARALARPTPGAPALPSGLPAHSYDYLHKITALSCMLTAPGRHGIALPAGEFERLVPVPRPRGIHSIHRLAKSAGVGTELLLQYNAGFRGGDIADDAPALILLPASAAARLSGPDVAASSPPPAEASEASAEGGTATQHVVGVPDHVVRRGDTLWRIARRHRIALADLLDWNGLATGSIIRPGQRLKLAPPRRGGRRVP